MEPRPITEFDREEIGGTRVIFKCPPEIENCDDVEVLRTVESSGGTVLCIPFQLTPKELALVGKGGTI